ncbi:hypothetical protein HPB50_011480 [Hyalomma asiaticum]|uniref:Uncharacterized protein n=1 Tax=Hyalomma asiaticum TaxID=266040 RepID=A0ACB7SMV4_HYAAI|nr:hypothetical protein HPB50_011480 [Hyalomma asiaticum]
MRAAIKSPIHRRRRDIACALSDKLKILQCLDSGQRQVDIAKEYGIAPSTLSTIVKQKSKLEGETSFNPTRKRLCTGHFKAVDDAVVGHANDPRAYYVDVAKYPYWPNTYAAAVIAANTGVLTTSESIRYKSPTQAEEFAIALALAIPDWRTVLSDSKPAIVNFATNNVHETTARPQRPDAEDEEYSITTNGDVLQWYRTSRRLYPPPHRDLQRSEAATLRQLQAKHVCPEVYTADICQHCKKARATQRHLLWDCAPPPGNQEEAMPTAISSKIISREPGNQRYVVQHMLSILARQRPKAAPPRRTKPPHRLTMEKKAAIIKQVESGRSQTVVGREFGISKQTVSDFIKNKAKILEVAAKSTGAGKKNASHGVYPQLEKALLVWLSAMIAKKIPVSGDILKQKAEIVRASACHQEYRRLFRVGENA